MDTPHGADNVTPSAQLPIFRVRESLIILPLSSRRIASILRVPDSRPACYNSSWQAGRPIIHLAPFLRARTIDSLSSSSSCDPLPPFYSGAAEPKPPMIVARLCDASFLRSICSGRPTRTDARREREREREANGSGG